MNLLLLESSDFIAPGRVKISDRRFLQLRDIIKLADGKTYTADTLAALNTALTEAKGLADDANQTAVDNAAAKLNAAIAGLKEEPVVTVTLGDVNGNGEVTAEDALMALQASTNKISLTADQTTAANVDKQDEVTANDALLILQFATKKIAQF